jgi:hypothetical protein
MNYNDELARQRKCFDCVKSLLTLNFLWGWWNRRIVAQMMALVPFFRKFDPPGNSLQNEPAAAQQI